MTASQKPRAPRRASPPRGPRPLWQVFAAHVAVLGLCLVLYAIPHHVIHKPVDASGGITSSRAQAPARTPAAPEALSADAAATPEPTPEPVGSFRGRFADRFTGGEVLRDENSYRSANLNVTFTTGYSDAFSSTWYVADIYIADISCLFTTHKGDAYGHPYKTWGLTVARDTEAVVTMNGDYFTLRDGGIVIRNGALYRDEKNVNDMCVLYWDGTIKTFRPSEFDARREMENGAYQGWCFGPALLDENGRAYASFDSSVAGRNPRSCIGYYEPGHYCFVVVDGRSKKNRGVTLPDLARFMQDLGCAQAFNLDGGQTSTLLNGLTVLNDPYKGGRKCSDFIVVADRVTPQ